MGFKLTTLVVVGTDDIGSHKSTYFTITTTTALLKKINFFSFIYDKCSCTQFYRHNISKRIQGKNEKMNEVCDCSLLKYPHLQRIRHTSSFHYAAADELVVPKHILCPVICASTEIGGEN